MTCTYVGRSNVLSFISLISDDRWDTHTHTHTPDQHQTPHTHLNETNNKWNWHKRWTQLSNVIHFIHKILHPIHIGHTQTEPEIISSMFTNHFRHGQKKKTNNTRVAPTLHHHRQIITIFIVYERWTCRNIRIINGRTQQ